MAEYEIMVDGQSVGSIYEQSVLGALCSTMEFLALTYVEHFTIIDTQGHTQTMFCEVIKETDGKISYGVIYHMEYPQSYRKCDGFKTNLKHSLKHSYYVFHCDSPKYAGKHKTCFRKQRTDFMARAGDGFQSVVQSLCEKHASEYCQWLGITYSGETIIHLDLNEVRNA